MPRAIVWLICREYGLDDNQADMVWQRVQHYPPDDLLTDTRWVIESTYPGASLRSGSDHG